MEVYYGNAEKSFPCFPNCSFILIFPPKISYNLIMSLKEKKLIRPLPFGISEFTEVIDRHCYYSDKTFLLKSLLDTETKVILFTRPRRFGKTLNMTMMRTFFEKNLAGKDTSHYFKNLKIWNAGEKYTKEQGKRPVIYITFKDIKQADYNAAFFNITKKISDEFKRHAELGESQYLTKDDIELYRKMTSRTADILEWESSLETLSGMLCRHYNNNVVIIIDEYDAPIQTAFENGYYEEMIRLMRTLLSGAFKDNPSLYRGMFTGITRVSKESIFSGLNNLKVDTIFDDYFADCFGLTAEEVSDMLDFYDISEKRKRRHTGTTDICSVIRKYTIRGQ